MKKLLPVIQACSMKNDQYFASHKRSAANKSGFSELILHA